MAPHRNQPLTQQQIDDRLKQYLGAERVVWLEHGSLIGDDTDGHIDTLVRICPDDTILYTGGDEDHPDLDAMERELQTLRTLDGRPYRLLKLPCPAPSTTTATDCLPPMPTIWSSTVPCWCLPTTSPTSTKRPCAW